MFRNRKTNSSPLGVPLGDLMAMLAPTSIEATVNGDCLIAQHEDYAICIEVVAPQVPEPEDGPIQAVVRMITDLPAPVLDMFRGREAAATAAINALAALSALYQDGQTIRIGSRLTIYEGEGAWETLHLPLLACTTIYGPQAIFGALRRTLTDETPRGGSSQWTQEEANRVFKLQQVAEQTGTRFSSVKVTLFRVAHGNLQTKPVAPDEF